MSTFDVTPRIDLGLEMDLAYGHMPEPVARACRKRKSCVKAGYGTKAEAIHAIRLQYRRGTRVVLRAYRCGRCGNWHMTKSELRGVQGNNLSVTRRHMPDEL